MQMKANKNGGKILAAVMAFAMVFAGIVVIADSSDAADVTYIHGTIIDDQPYYAGKVVVDGDLLINNGATLTIATGVEFTISAGATVTVDGVNSNDARDKAAIVISGDDTSVAVNGKLVVGENGTVTVSGGNVAINGSVEVLRGGSFNAASPVTLKSGATFDVNSAANKISTVSGIIQLMDGSTLNMKGQVGDGSSLTVKSVGESSSSKVFAGSSVVITDSDDSTAVAKLSTLTFTVDSQITSGYNAAGDKFTITCADLIVKGTVQGGDDLKFVDVPLAGTYYDKKDAASRVPMDIQAPTIIDESLNVLKDGSITIDTAYVEVSGSVSVVAEENTVKKVAFTADGTVLVTGTVNFSADNFDGTGDAAGKIWVIDGIVTITGTVTTLNQFNLTEVYGACYQTNAALIITDLEDALEAADGINIVQVDLFAGSASQTSPYTDAYVLSSDVTVKDYVSLKVWNGLLVSEGVTVTIEQYAAVDNGSWNGVILVEGKVIDRSLSLEAVDTTVTTSNFVKCEVVLDIEDGAAKVFTTLAIAIDGAASGDEISLVGNAEINGKVIIPAGITLTLNGKTLAVNTDSELIVDGVVNASTGEITTASATDTRKAGVVTINNIVIVADVTAFYFVTVGVLMDSAEIGDLSGDMIVSINVFAENSEDQEGTTFGKITYAGDLTFMGPLTVVSEVVINGTITLVDTYVTVTDAQAASLTAKIAATNGTIELAKVKNITVTNLVDAEAETPVDDLVISGEPSTGTDGKLSIATGEVVAKALNASAITSFGVASGTTLTIKENSTVGAIKIEGKLDVEAGTLNTGNITVLGEVVIADGAKIETAGNAYVGITSSSLNATGASVTGDDVTFTGVMYVSSDATVSEDIIEGKDVIEFVVDGVTFVKAYKGATAVSATVAKAPVENAYFQGWLVGDSTVPTTTVEFVTGETVTATAKVKTDIYTVSIIADNGIGTVSLDGNVLTKYSNTFIVPTNIAAGQHTISYILKNGYEGTVQMTVDGQKVSGYTFTAAGTNDDGSDVEILINLSGTTPAVTPTPEPEPTPEPSGDDGMGITEYLLIVLVVLAAILVVIVAARMMRS